MGQHTLRRTTGISTSTGRAIFTGAAALALVSGGTGMAFAGEADTSASHSDDSDNSDEGHDEDDDHGDEDDAKGHDDDQGDGDDKDGDDKDDDKPESCEIPIYANLIEDVDAFDEDLTDDALKPANEATAEAVAPIEDAVCPIVADELNTVDDDLGAGPEDDAEMLGTSPTGL